MFSSILIFFEQHHTHLSQDSFVNYLVFDIYVPTNTLSTNAEASVPSDYFYDLFPGTLSSVPPGGMVIFLGNFNAHVGSDFVSHCSVIDPHSLVKCNENEIRLLYFCVSNELFTMNIWF